MQRYCAAFDTKKSTPTYENRGFLVLFFAAIYIYIYTHISFTKAGGRKIGLGVGSPGTPINMSSFNLQNEFFLSLELRRPSETTYGDSPLAEANV